MTAINPRVIADLKALQPGLLGELIDAYLRDAGQQIAQLREAAGARNSKSLLRTAAALKGSSGNLGAQALSRICADLQPAAQSADWTRIGALLAGLDEEYRAVKSELLVAKNQSD